MSSHAARSSARFAKASERWTADDGAALASDLGLPAGSSILDVGGGTGVLAGHLAAASASSVTVLDRDSLTVEKAQRAGVTSVLGDAGAMPFEDAIFDGVLFVDAFHHLGDQQAAIRETARVLKHGGVVLVAERNPGYFAAKLTFWYERLIGESVSAHGPQELVQMFRTVGIEGVTRYSAGDSYMFTGVRK